MTGAGFEPTTLRSEGICLATFSALTYLWIFFVVDVFFQKLLEFKAASKVSLNFSASLYFLLSLMSFLEKRGNLIL